MDLPDPFAFQNWEAGRRHGPAGYVNYQEYKDWLRDEFTFRCGYCLEREAWYPSRQGAFAVEHIVPKSIRPDLTCDYENLAYACVRCNSFKQDCEALDPIAVDLGDHVSFQTDGSVVGLTDEGRQFIDLFRLGIPSAVEVRHEKLRILRLKRLYPENDDVDQLFRRTFGYPDDLPDLRPTAKRPKGNSRPDGVQQSHFVRRLNGLLPAVY